ncbi:hypothetical protein EYR40_000082 [Pleurotus pulmonarius]|nr:hypothetical protein EYR36_001560 [Pleurotus pulmonarius]KAF4607747.1 hypothetical protein EYR40_000082 [Pleurotus pulmonarius]
MGRIHDLPIEIFTAVLRCVVHRHIDEAGSYQWTNETPAILQSLSIAQVCQRWRQFALNTPSLWTIFDGELTPLLIDYALKLSSNLPLKLCLDLQSDFHEGDGSGDEGWDAPVRLQWGPVLKLVSQIPRTSHLIVRLLPQHASRFISKLSQEAPLLVHLEIDNDDNPDPCVLPHTIFDGKCPLLRHLVLHYCEIPDDSPLLRHLTTLVLTWLPPIDLVGLLSKTESLETLRISHLYDLRTSQAGMVTLPKLRQLSLTAVNPVESCIFVLNSIKCSNASLRIIIQPNEEKLMNLFCACRQWLSNGSGMIDNLKIDGCHVRQDIQVEGFSSTDPTLRFSITIVDDYNDIKLAKAVALALANLPVSNVHTLHFYNGLLGSQEFWAAELSKSLPNLRTVELCPLSAPHWFEVFAWCMTCGATPCLLHGVQEVVVRRFPNEWPTLGENMDIVRDARLTEGRPIVYRYEDSSSQLPNNMYG